MLLGINSSYFSYCLSTRSGGLKLTLEMTKIQKTISFLVDGTIRPVCLLSLDGEMLYFNKAFEGKIGFALPSRIQDLLDVESVRLWNSFINSLSQLKEPNNNMTINSPFENLNGMVMQLKYLEDVQQIIALFEWPAWDRLAVFKLYDYTFKNSDDFMVIIDETGTIIEVNGLSNKFFKLPREFFIGKSYENIVRLLNIDSDTLIQQTENAFANGVSEKVID